MKSFDIVVFSFLNQITYMELEYLVAIGIIPSLHSAPTANNQICASEVNYSDLGLVLNF